jgi:hypothetical protein
MIDAEHIVININSPSSYLTEWTNADWLSSITHADEHSPSRILTESIAIDNDENIDESLLSVSSLVNVDDDEHLLSLNEVE